MLYDLWVMRDAVSLKGVQACPSVLPVLCLSFAAAVSEICHCCACQVLLSQNCKGQRLLPSRQDVRLCQIRLPTYSTLTQQQDLKLGCPYPSRAAGMG